MQKTEKTKSFAILFSIIGFGILISLFKDSIKSGDLPLIQSILSGYLTSTASVVKFIYNLLGENLIYDTDTSSFIIENNNILTLNYHFLTIRLTIIYILLVIIFPLNWQKSILFFIGGLIIIFVVNVFTILLSINMGADPVRLRNITRFFMLIPIYFLIIYKLRNQSFLYSYDKLIKKKVSESFSIKLEFIVLLFVSFNFLKVNFMHYVSVVSLKKVVLFLSKYILSFTDYDIKIVDSIIYLNRVWVTVGDGCVGVIMMLVFIIFIFIQKGALFNKLIFSFAGALILILINSLRIVFILLNLYNNGGKLAGWVNAHDFYNYISYLFMIIFWLVYIKWFRHIVFFKSPKRLTKIS